MAEISEKRKVVIGITGSIAAYKSAELARLLVSRGYEVRAIMTASAQKFLGVATMEAITGNEVVADFWDSSEVIKVGHIHVADWAETIVVAPATANFIAKLASGIADSPLLAACLATRAPILLAPAMNVNMLENGATQENIDTLKKRGALFIDSEEGELACGWNGSGRMASAWEVFHHVRRSLSDLDLESKKILITTGPTREAIDPVRYISNRSSGKMGVALALEAFRRGAEVTLVHGPVAVHVPAAIRCKGVVTGEEMKNAIFEELEAEGTRPDIVVMASAVSDYKPKQVAGHKIKKHNGLGKLELSESIDILAELGKAKKQYSDLKLVGFAVETGELDDLLNEARAKMSRKNTDMIVCNFAEDAFDLDTNRAWILDIHGREEEVSTTFKSRVASRILNAVRKL